MKKLVFLIPVIPSLAASAFAQLTINSVSPASAEPGTSGLTVTFMLPNSTPPTPPVNVVPTSVMVGTISGTSISRVSLDTVTAVFDIPVDATGSLNCSVTFPSPSGNITFTKTGGFTVGSGGSSGATSEYGPPASGYNLYSPITSTETFLTDNDGNVVKTWSSSYNPGQSVYLLDDGSLMRTANTGSASFDTGGAGGRVEKYDWDGNLVWHYDYDTSDHRLHHDIEVLPNGNILMIAWEKKTEAEALAAGRDPNLLDTAELWPDTIIEIEPTGSNGGNIVWEWHVWDHLIQDYNASANNYGVVADHPEKINLNYTQSGANDGNADWNHMNSIDYNAEHDQILVSVRNLSEIWVIDHSTTTAEATGTAGDLLYRWGNPAAHGASGDQQLFSQHNAQWIEAGLAGEGSILIFNNGAGRPDGDYSTVDEVTLPRQGDNSYDWGTAATLVWSYVAPTPTNFYASHISGAQRLRNGNTLVCEGTKSHVFEVNTDGGLVWEYSSTDGNLFRFERYAPDFAGFANTELALPTVSYPVVDTHETAFYDNSGEITEPGSGDAFYGQDANYAGPQPTYDISPDGKTVYDYNTRLTWTRSPDWNGDGTIDINDKMTQSDAETYVATANANNYGGYSDWRLPTIKEVYSLMDFRGTDPMNDDTSTLVPFINPDYFEFAWGDTANGERTVDSQVATSTIHVDPVMGGGVETMPGINIVDGRIKSYPVSKVFLVYLCRGNTSYGANDFIDNGDSTVTDRATGLMWAQNDSGSGMLWQDALAYVQTQNTANHLGHNDWRLPNAKELQSIVNYSRAPTATGSPAIDPVFNCTEITNEEGVKDWPWYFTGTTHIQQDGGAAHAVYVCFGRAMGYFNNAWEDVHGAGAQRSESKAYNTSGYTYIPDGWYFTSSPQGDAARWYNYVRLVRDADLTEAPPAIFVDADTPATSGSQDGTSWATAFASLQDAIASASSGDEIWVAEGIYYPDEAEAGIATVVNDDMFSSFNLKQGVAVYGGFSGTETDRSQRNIETHVCVLSGDIDHDSGGADNTVNGVVESDPTSNIIGTNADEVITGIGSGDTLLDGFTITAAARAATSGGACYRRCIIQGNHAAAYHEDNTVTYVDCDIIANSSTGDPIIWAGGTDIEMVSCRIMNNEVTGTEGFDSVVCIGSSTARMVNCLVAGNKGYANGAVFVPVITGISTPLRILNCTIADNLHSGSTTGNTAGGLSVESGAAAEVSNTVIWGNSGTANANVSGSITYDFCLVEGIDPGGDNLDGTDAGNDPLFIKPLDTDTIPFMAGDYDYRLQSQSPLIGTGVDASNPADSADLDEDGDTTETIPYDLAGISRVIGIMDIGAYEYDGTDSDSDGVSDVWELANGFDINAPNDFLRDSDGDGDSDLLEIYQGTDRNDPVQKAGIYNLAVSNATNTVTFSYLRDASQNAVEGHLVWSVDLQNWHRSDELAGGVSVQIIEAPSHYWNDWEFMRVSSTTTTGSTDKLFYALSLTPKN